MIGAIIGDIAGSRFEWNNIKTKDFEIFSDKSFVTDDSIMTISLAKAVIESDGNIDALSGNAAKYMREIGRNYPGCGFGGNFYRWIFSDNAGPYKSKGNGAAMRVSPAGYAAKTMDEARLMSEKITAVTHNHPEGINGAEAVTAAIFMARTGSGKAEIKDYINAKYYPMNFTIDEIRPRFRFSELCRDTVPQALELFFESESFEDAIRSAVSLGGDCDTVAAVCGSVAGAYYGVPKEMRDMALTYLDDRLLGIYLEFEKRYM